MYTEWGDKENSRDEQTLSHSYEGACSAEPNAHNLFPQLFLFACMPFDLFIPILHELYMPILDFMKVSNFVPLTEEANNNAHMSYT